MRQIGMRDTSPELRVREILRALEVRYRLHAKELPGKPDIVRRPDRWVIFVHGCFWHQHSRAGCLDGRKPKSNTVYWHEKLARNVRRDKTHAAALRRLGWRVLVVWECEALHITKARRKIERFLAKG